MKKIICWILYIIFLIGCSKVGAIEPVSKNKRKLIILSIDGFPGYYLDDTSLASESLKNIKKLIKKSSYSNTINSVYPTLTYPAHTSMITGVNAKHHGIYYNTPLDPFRELEGDWLWFDENIKVKTIMDFAKESGLKTANIYWPVTVGANIDLSIPQFWKNKTNYDEKYLKSFSTKDLYKQLSLKTGVQVGEFSGDREKLLFATELWKLHSPDIMLVYTTDLDTVHHEKGVYSKEALEKLNEIDKFVGDFIKNIELQKNHDLRLIIVSDHGFKRVDNICYPNKFIQSEEHVKSATKQWNYVFKTLGGMAVLYKNPNEKTKVNDKKISLSELKEKIESSCPGVLADYEGQYFKEAKDSLNGNLLMFLYSKENIALSETLNPAQAFKAGGIPYYNHGFLPEDGDLKTILITYPKLEESFNSVKDVYRIGCDWLKLECKAGEKRK